MSGLVAFFATFAVYAWTASPAIGWLDSPEFVAASASLGVAHSPGHPLPALLGHAGSYLPVGDVVFRVNLMAAAAAAFAAWALWWTASLLLARVAPGLGERARTALSLACALVFAFSWAAWFQGVRAEVYGIEAALILVALRAVIAWDTSGETRHLYAGSLAAGLALANHHLIAATFLVPAAVFVLARRAPPKLGARAAGVTAAMGILGLASLSYLPVRAAQSPEVNWGAPDTASRFAWTVSARAFQKAVVSDHASTPAEDAAQVTFALGDHATPLLAFAALLALYLAARGGWLRHAALLAAIAACGAAARVLVGFDPETPDHHGYLVPAVAALVLLGVAGLAALAEAVAHASTGASEDGGLPRAPAAAVALIATILVPIQLVRNADDASLRGARASDEVAVWEVEALPPRSLVLTSYFQTSFRVSAMRSAFGSRPDVAFVDRSFLTYPGAAEEAKKRYPALAELIDAPLRAGAPTPIEALSQLARRRPVLMQLHPNVDAAAEPYLVPGGPFAYVAGRRPRDAVRREAEALDADARRALARRLTDLVPGDRTGARAALLWHDFTRLRHYCATGRRAAAAAVLADARVLAPGDATLDELAEDCGLDVGDVGKSGPL